MEHAGCPYIVASTSFVNAIRANSLAVAQWLQTGHLIVSRGDSLFLQGCSDGQYSRGQFSIRVFSRIPVSKFDTDAIRAPNMPSSLFLKFLKFLHIWSSSSLLGPFQATFDGCTFYDKPPYPSNDQLPTGEARLRRDRPRSAKKRHVRPDPVVSYVHCGSVQG